MPHLPKKQKRRAYLPKQKRTSQNSGKLDRFHHSSAWRRYSRIYKENNPMCEVCNVEIAQVTDHIIPMQGDERQWPTDQGGSAWREENHMSMCHRCHNIKRGKEGHGFEVASIQTQDGKIPSNRQDIINVLTGKKP